MLGGLELSFWSEDLGAIRYCFGIFLKYRLRHKKYVNSIIESLNEKPFNGSIR